jgi:hypothetical protein
MTRRLLGLAAAALVLAGSGCVSDPTDALSGEVTGVRASLSAIQVDVGDSTLITAEATDQQGNALTILPEVSTLDAAIATVTVADIPPLPQRRFYIKGVSFGEGRVIVTAGQETDTITVRTWPATIGISGVNARIRSGESATISLTGLDVSGNPVTGVSPISLTVDDTTVLALDTTTNTVTARNSGFATLTAYGPVNAQGDTVAEGTFAVRVVSAVPSTAAMSATTFGGLGAAEAVTLEVVVEDTFGNQNVDSAEVLSASFTSSNPAVATVAVTVQDTNTVNGPERHIFVTVTGVSAGAINVTGSVTTTQGVLAVGAVPATVLAPVVTAANPSTGPGALLTINGSGLTAAGFETLVLVDGFVAGNITAASASSVTVRMPTFLPGAHDLEVSVGGVVSNTDTWTQTGSFNEAGSEPNDDPGQEALIGASFEFSGSADEDTDFSDLFQFVVSGDDFEIDLRLVWGDGNDLDVLIYPIGAQDPGDYSEDTCGFALSSLANPESGTCTLGAAGTYTLEVLHYGSGPTTYTVRGRIRAR